MSIGGLLPQLAALSAQKSARKFHEAAALQALQGGINRGGGGGGGAMSGMDAQLKAEQINQAETRNRMLDRQAFEQSSAMDRYDMATLGGTSSYISDKSMGSSTTFNYDTGSQWGPTESYTEGSREDPNSGYSSGGDSGGEAMAMGGRVQAGGLYHVAEGNTPEVYVQDDGDTYPLTQDQRIIPKESGVIVPNSQVGGLAPVSTTAAPVGRTGPLTDAELSAARGEIMVPRAKGLSFQTSPSPKAAQGYLDLKRDTDNSMIGVANPDGSPAVSERYPIDGAYGLRAMMRADPNPDRPFETTDAYGNKIQVTGANKYAAMSEQARVNRRASAASTAWRPNPGDPDYRNIYLHKYFDQGPESVTGWAAPAGGLPVVIGNRPTTTNGEASGWQNVPQGKVVVGAGTGNDPYRYTEAQPGAGATTGNAATPGGLPTLSNRPDGQAETRPRVQLSGNLERTLNGSFMTNQDGSVSLVRPGSNPIYMGGKLLEPGQPDQVVAKFRPLDKGGYDDMVSYITKAMSPEELKANEVAIKYLANQAAVTRETARQRNEALLHIGNGMSEYSDAANKELAKGFGLVPSSNLGQGPAQPAAPAGQGGQNWTPQAGDTQLNSLPSKEQQNAVFTSWTQAQKDAWKQWKTAQNNAATPAAPAQSVRPSAPAAPAPAQGGASAAPAAVGGLVPSHTLAPNRAGALNAFGDVAPESPYDFNYAEGVGGLPFSDEKIYTPADALQEWQAQRRRQYELMKAFQNSSTVRRQ